DYYCLVRVGSGIVLF
nr:immunoglobulin light chain junction region [Macaca mulatta]